MARSKVKPGPWLAHLQELKVEYLERMREANKLEHKEKTIGRSSILETCEPDCPACARWRELLDFLRELNAVEKELMAEASRRAIVAAGSRGPAGAEAAQERCFDTVIDNAIRKRREAGAQLKVHLIHNSIRDDAIKTLERRKWPAKVLLDEGFVGAIESAFRADGPVRPRKEWLNLPERRVIERRLKELRPT